MSFEGWNFQSHTLTSGEKEGAGDQVQSPTAHYFIDHVCLMELPSQPKEWDSGLEDTRGTGGTELPEKARKFPVSSHVQGPGPLFRPVVPELYPFTLIGGSGKERLCCVL